MRKTMPISEARAQLMTLASALGKEQNTVKVTKRGEPVLAIIPWEVYESLMETMEIMGDTELMAQLHNSIREIEEDRTISWEDAKAELNR